MTIKRTTVEVVVNVTIEHDDSLDIMDVLHNDDTSLSIVSNVHRDNCTVEESEIISVDFYDDEEIF